jgi:ribokinase
MHSLLPQSVIVLGDINVDLTLQVPLYPSQGDDVAAQSLRWGSGGAALNMATMFARLGAFTQLIGRVGRDLPATIALQFAQQAGVNIELIQHDAHNPTGICSSVVIPEGQRTFFTYRGANVYLTADQRVLEHIAASKLLVVTAYALLESQQRNTALLAMSHAKTYGIPIVLDLCLPAARNLSTLIGELIPDLWLLTLNEAELQALLPGQSLTQASDILLRAGATHVVVKRGNQGCTIMMDGRMLIVLPPAVNAFDTNGCGDAFVAGYSWALLHDAELPACAALGNVLGALTATKPGAADALPTRDEIMRNLDYRYHYLLTEE